MYDVHFINGAQFLNATAVPASSPATDISPVGRIFF